MVISNKCAFVLRVHIHTDKHLCLSAKLYTLTFTTVIQLKLPETVVKISMFNFLESCSESFATVETAPMPVILKFILAVTDSGG